MKAKVKIEKPFRIESANELYHKMGRDNSDCYEYGIDTGGMVYFALANGVVKRYSRRQFIKMSK